MTDHAILRIAQRVPDYQPSEVLQAIRAATLEGAFLSMVGLIDGKRVAEIRLPRSGQHIFPVLGDAGEVVTVLTEGMVVATPAGDKILRRAGVALGVHQDMPSGLYHSDPCGEPSLSATLIKELIGKSPLHAWTKSPRLNPDWKPEEKKHFDIGRAAHRAILGKGDEFAEIPGRFLSKNGAINGNSFSYKEWEHETRSRGDIPLKAEEIDKVHAMKAKADIVLAELGINLDPAQSELAVFARLESGIIGRCMVDNAPLNPSEPLYDFKTCESAAWEKVEKSIYSMGYHMQGAFYREVWKAATGEDRAFRFIFQEKEPPYEIAVAELDFEALGIGEKQNRRAQAIWKICLKNNNFPGYRRGIIKVPLPAWYVEQWLNRETEEAEVKRRTGTDVYEAVSKWQSPQPFTGDLNND